MVELRLLKASSGGFHIHDDRAFQQLTELREMFNDLKGVGYAAYLSYNGIAICHNTKTHPTLGYAVNAVITIHYNGGVQYHTDPDEMDELLKSTADNIRRAVMVWNNEDVEEAEEERKRLEEENKLKHPQSGKKTKPADDGGKSK